MKLTQEQIIEREFRKSIGDSTGDVTVTIDGEDETITVEHAEHVWVMELGSDDSEFTFTNSQEPGVEVTFEIPSDWE